MRTAYAIVLVLGGIALGACVAPQLSPTPTNAAGETSGTVLTKPAVTQWEYKVVGYSDEAKISELGAQGWELVSIIQETKIGYVDDLSKRLFFKRPKQ